MLQNFRKDLKAVSSKERAKSVSGFFKTGKGQYGEGDIFIGVTVPDTRKLAKKYAHQLDAKSLKALMCSPIHEERLCALMVLVDRFQKAQTDKDRKKIVDFYLKHLSYVNNWDLVDLSAPKILGAYLLEKDKTLLKRLVRSKVLWDRRVAVVTTYAFIRKGDFEWTFSLSEKLLQDKEDLMHKACGWMLREVGKVDEQPLKVFLKKYAASMPRTMLRYAIERFPEKTRKAYLALPRH